MLDIKKMKEKLSQLNNKGGGSSSFFKPVEGTQNIRIVPTADGDPFKAFHFHYNLGDKGFLCPKRNFGDDCPACEFVRKLFADGNDESVAMAKQLMAKQRFASPILVRDEAPEVKIWTYSKTVYEELLKLVLNPDYGDITDVDEGFDLTLEYGKPAGAMFYQSKITPRRKTSALCEDMDSEECSKLLDTVPDFASLWPRKTTEEVQVLLDAKLDDDSEDVEQYGGTVNAVDAAVASLGGN